MRYTAIVQVLIDLENKRPESDIEENREQRNEGAK